MEKTLSLLIFIDGFGWEILQRHPNFLSREAPERKRLDTIFGYSSACDPSIISGLVPSQHLQWSSFFYSPDTCPYPWVRNLRFLPQVATDYHRVRHRLSRFIQWVHGFTGYFQIYNVPFNYLPYFDYAEKIRIFAPEGLRRGRNIFDQLKTAKIPYYVDDSGRPDSEKIQQMGREISKGEVGLAYVLLGGLDGFMHGKGPYDPHVSQLIQNYEQSIQELLATAEKNYDSVSLYVFSDHGMHQVEDTYDLQAEIKKLNLEFGKDYAAVYDSTMARYWYLNERARKKITECLAQLGCGRVIPDQELEKLGAKFPDHMYGETIFLMNAPTLIAPSFMNRKYLPGMHGFHPSEPDSYAMIASNQSLPSDLTSIEQIFWLMLRDTKAPEPDNSDIPDFAWRSRLE